MQALRLRSRVSSFPPQIQWLKTVKRTESKGIASGIAHSLLLYTVVSPVFSYHLLESSSCKRPGVFLCSRAGPRCGNDFQTSPFDQSSQRFSTCPFCLHLRQQFLNSLSWNCCSAADCKLLLQSSSTLSAIRRSSVSFGQRRRCL